MKAVLEKAGHELEFEDVAANFSPNIFDRFQEVCKEDIWKAWIEEKVILATVSSRMVSLFDFNNKLGRDNCTQSSCTFKKAAP